MKEIQLTQGAVAIVDDDDYEFLSQFKWCFSEGYAVRGTSKKGKKFSRLMHREILRTPVGMYTDHINGNGLDNRRENLRICTNSQNLINRSSQSNNTSGYKGVSYNKQRKVWVAQLSINKKQVLCKHFSTPEEAARSYNESARKYFGEFAKLNVIGCPNENH